MKPHCSGEPSVRPASPHADALYERYLAGLTQTMDWLFPTLQDMYYGQQIGRGVPICTETSGRTRDSVMYCHAGFQMTDSYSCIPWESFWVSRNVAGRFWQAGFSEKAALILYRTRKETTYTVSLLYREKADERYLREGRKEHLETFALELVTEIFDGRVADHRSTLTAILRGLDMLDRYRRRSETNARAEEHRLSCLEAHARQHP